MQVTLITTLIFILYFSYRLRNIKKVLYKSRQPETNVILDSCTNKGHRATTLLVRIPRIVLAELNTHRAFSRNSASSRAIPLKRMIKSIREDMFIPMAFLKSHKGMQGSDYHDKLDFILRLTWYTAAQLMILMATLLNKMGVTKQLSNRLLEPFMWHSVLITSTEWENFFQQRCPRYLTPWGDTVFSKATYNKKLVKHGYIGANYASRVWLNINKGAGEIHMMAAAESILNSLKSSDPQLLKPNEWHIPFIDGLDISNLDQTLVGKPPSNVTKDLTTWINIKVGTARCAHTSYNNFKGDKDFKADCKLHDKLINNMHYSPSEHILRAMDNTEYTQYTRAFLTHVGGHTEVQHSLGWCRNVRGFIQYRSLWD